MTRLRSEVNPLLKLLTKPQPKPAQGGGKGRKDIRQDLFAPRQKMLATRFGEIGRDPQLRESSVAGRVLIRVTMDEKSAAPSYVPRDLFAAEIGANLVAPWRRGYLAEVSTNVLSDLQDRVLNAHMPIACRVDVSRIESVSLLSTDLLSTDFEQIWNATASVNGEERLFIAHTAPFHSPEARQLIADEIKSKTVSTFAIESLNRLANDELTDTIGLFLSGLTAQLPVACSSQETMRRLVASGAVIKWEPVRPLVPTRTNDIAFPNSPLPDLDGAPIVGVVDGGLLPGRYDGAVAWRAAPFVQDTHAAREHGTHVASLLVEADRWDNNLQIPPLSCRIGVAQAVARLGAPVQFRPDEFLLYLNDAMAIHRDTRVWNISANLPEACDQWNVSYFGHMLSLVARRYDNNVVISAGNRDGDDKQLSPPADSEAAITVSGRLHFSDGSVAGPCPESRVGLGPDGMLKPDASWFSNHAFGDGSVLIGTSYAAPLISRMAAHTWENVKNPSADLVKAIIINAGDLEYFSHQLGFGSPVVRPLPWEVPRGTVVVAWTENLYAGANYYWRNIHIPSSMIKGGFLVGRLRLTAVLKPKTSLSGSGNYFSSRLQTALQYQQPDGQWKRLIGGLPVDTAEGIARSEDAKWQPTRCYEGYFLPRDEKTKGDGCECVELSLQKIRVFARVFERDGFASAADAEEESHAVSFVLSLEDREGDQRTFDEFVQVMGMGINVENAVVDQHIPVSSDAD